MPRATLPPFTRSFFARHAVSALVLASSVFACATGSDESSGDGAGGAGQAATVQQEPQELPFGEYYAIQDQAQKGAIQVLHLLPSGSDHGGANDAALGAKSFQALIIGDVDPSTGDAMGTNYVYGSYARSTSTHLVLEDVVDGVTYTGKLGDASTAITVSAERIAPFQLDIAGCDSVCTSGATNCAADVSGSPGLISCADAANSSN